MKVEIVISDCYGSGLVASRRLIEKLKEIKKGKGEEVDNSPFLTHTMRHDPDLVRCVKELGEKASPSDPHIFSHIIVKEVELPSGQYYVDNRDGKEEIVIPEEVDWVQVY